MLAAYRTRRVFRMAVDCEIAQRIRDAKGMEMVYYLRARHAIADPRPSRFISYAQKNKKFARSEFFRSRRKSR